MPDIDEQRTTVEAEIAGLTLVEAVRRTARERGAEPAYSDRRVAAGSAGSAGSGGSGGGTGWRTVTWAEVHDRARELAATFLESGLEPGDVVAIMCSSRIEHVVADLAAVLAGGVPVSVYNTLSPEQVGYVSAQAAPRIVVLETDDHARRWSVALADRPEISRVVTIDATPDADARAVTWSEAMAEGAAALGWQGPALLARGEAVRPDDPVTILYTSGTTGAPKGVVLTHRNICFEAVASARTAHLEGPGVSVSYLPFAHIAERILGMYIPQLRGGHVHLIDDPSQLVPTLLEVRPTRFFGVPRVWEKIRTGVSARLAAEPDEARRSAVERALAVGLSYVESTQTGHTTSPELAARFDAVDAAVLRPLRAALGLDRVEWAASAAAPMPVDVARFLAGLGLRVYDVYGLTETTSSATACGPGSFRLGTVGRPHPGVELRLADDGEILVRGPIATPGYHRAPEATAELLDADGWVHTGDVGVLDDDGFLRVVDRKKELIITSSGKNIAPSTIENALKESPLIGHAMVVGDGHPYLVAILTLDGEVAPVVARGLGVQAGSLAELARHPAIRAAVAAAVDAANARLSRPEQVKAFELLAQEWTVESEELTPTLKLKRRVVGSKYADVIDRLYGQPA
ncbi:MULTISPECIES: AMP-dependent synthetase/ligase [Pseudofrankia]|uniref:AMP-dependent synthetase/ligase n=1 Tax=Pseudofrankia TaxID=2994363 RepID=UPI000234CA06|nr:MULTISPECIES: long-chain fatty acid--CoA ligase [Pseudofrankia]OHV34113.1 AMP-dependent synthetase [Pseudofrankia sp. EUN1h]